MLQGVTVGRGFTVTATVATDTQLFESVMLIVYVVVAVGVAIADCDVDELSVAEGVHE